MGGNSKYYDVEGYETWKKSRGKAIIPPRANFLAAVFYIRNLLDGKKFTWAATGSLAMLCLGARREMPDVHIVYDDRDFIRLKGKLDTDQRTRLPTSMNTLFPSKLLISTGPKYKDSGCTENVDVEVNLLPPGSHGAPANDILRSNMVLLSLKSEGKDTGVKGLNILYLVRTMLAFYKIRELSWDPRRDVLFLCQHYGREIESVRGQLVQRDVQENFLGTSFFAKLTPEDQRLCYQVLLGKEPPPKMSLTPAPTQLSSSAPESARPRIPSHNSSPSLNTAMQQQSALLTPPKPGKKTKSRPSTAGSAAPSSQAQVPAPAPAPVPGKPLSQIPPTSTTTSRDTRSRYRPVNSAPNTPSASRNVSPDAPSSIASRPKSMANNMSAQQPAAPSLKSQSVSLQNIPNAAKPRVDSMHPPNPNSTQTRKSMPNLQAGPTGKVPAYAHAQQVQGMPQGAPLPPQGYQFQGFSPALAMGPAQSAQIPGVPPFPHQGFAGPVESTHIGPAHHAQFHPTPPIPQQGFSGQIEYGSVGPAHQAQFLPTPPIPQQNFTSQFQPGPPGPTYNGRINANPIPPQARGGHHVPKLAANPIGHPEEKPLRLVGHDGVYGAPAKQAPAKPTPKFPEHQSTKTYGSPSLSSFVFELDAGPSEPIKPFIPQPSGFIAELPAVDVSPVNWPVEPQTGNLAAPATLKQPEYDVSSIAPPKTMQTTPAVIAASASTVSSTHLPGSAFPPHAVSAPVPVPIPANARISTYLPPHVPTAASHSAPVPISRPVSAYVHPEPAIVPPPAPASSSVPASTAAPVPPYAPPAIPTVEPTPGPVTNLPTPPTEVPEPLQTTIHPSLLEALPASLMIGGPVGPRRSPNNSLSGPSTHSSNVASNSNAQVYQRYYSPPSSTPSSTQPSPRQDPVYKAYSRPISPPAIGAELSNSHSAPHVSHSQATYPMPQSMPLGCTVDSLTPQTPADMLGLSLSEAPKPNYEHVNDACKPQAQAHPIHNSFAPQQPPEFFNPFASYEPGHKRSASHESQASNASHDSTKLAAEYQQELPDFDNGYSSKAAATPVANYTGAGYGRRDSMDFT